MLEVIQFDEPLPDPLIEVIAAAIKKRPELQIRAFSLRTDSLSCLEGLEAVRRLSVDGWYLLSFDALEGFRSLEHLQLGQTNSVRPSLSFLQGHTNLRGLRLHGQTRDLDVIKTIPSLEAFELVGPRVRSHEPLREHPGIISLTLGSAHRDLSVLPTLPQLRCLNLGIRNMTAADFAPLSLCQDIRELSITGGSNVHNLKFLTGALVRTVAVLRLWNMENLASFKPISDFKALRVLQLNSCRASNSSLDGVTNLPAIQAAYLTASSSQAAVKRFADDFHGSVLYLAGTTELRGLLGGWARGDDEVSLRVLHDLAHWPKVLV